MQLRLQAEPTFEAKVPIHVPGKGPVDMSWTFKHRDRKELDQFLAGESQGLEDVAYILAIASGWGLTEPFNAENIGIFLGEYHAAARAIANKYLHELSGVKEKN